ncbi:sugar ABC transporter ATP-binding protein [Leucobacter sp. CSA1]|uniref:Sugar ABC transporter ATP-binding protein n=1 Tax=Leucobacter chromiisoli TaxID=2796471 RepID=A0A934Q9T4_9MICO|nr:sugar ABC transporter ATP-binding protein [Leucobacter chromiisoli]MBK0419806.1 sugar ABC transporter ATP-binding protein [Leucobacter chromiisoli]
MTDAEAALRVRGLEMAFDGVTVLDDVDLEVGRGEIHALLGLNGSGKSTLVKCLTGVYAPVAGQVEVFGHHLPLPVRDAAAHGIAVVHQDTGFVPEMTVLENLGASTGYGAGLLSPVRVARETEVYRALLDDLGLDIPLHAKIADLSAADVAMLAVVRALHVLDSEHGGRLFVLDEPTATLGRAEAEVVLGLMRRIAASGAGVIFIGHRLREVFSVCDRATVLRDGRVVHSGPIAELDHNSVVQHMLGQRVGSFFPDPPELGSDETRVRISELSGGPVREFSLSVGSGEIVGITGLLGMGHEAVPALLTGDRRPDSGSVEIDGRPVVLRHPADGIAAGIGRITADRLREGCWVEGSARENLTLPVLSRFFRGGWLRRSAESRYAAGLLDTVRLHPAEPERAMTSFSGGNQQKVMFAKWDQLEPSVFVLHEPTQGVDPSAGRELMDRIVARAEAGAAVILVSGDHEQLVELCHRVVVMIDGTLATEIPRAELSEERLLLACSA